MARKKVVQVLTEKQKDLFETYASIQASILIRGFTEHKAKRIERVLMEMGFNEEEVKSDKRRLLYHVCLYF